MLENNIQFDSESKNNYNESNYNSYGWVRSNDVLSSLEWKEFTEKFASTKNGTIFEKTNTGEFIIPVGQNGYSGIDNILVFAKGTMSKPQISRIIKINLENETELDLVREDIFENESKGIQTENTQLFKIYSNTDEGYTWESYKRRRSSTNAQSNNGSKNGTGSSGKTQFSLSIGNEDVTGQVETTKDLVALHNLTEDKLLKVLSLGGFPMPSIAVTKVDLPHNNFGDMNIGYDDNYAYIYKAIDSDNSGYSNDYKVVEKITIYEKEEIDDWYKEIKYNNGRNRSKESDSIVYAYIDKYGYDRGRGESYNKDFVSKYGENGQVGGLYQREYKGNTKSNSNESSRNKQNVSFSLKDSTDSEGNVLSKQQQEIRRLSSSVVRIHFFPPQCSCKNHPHLWEWFFHCLMCLKC